MPRVASFKVGRHEQNMQFHEGKLFKFSCTCRDFMFRHLKQQEESVEKIIATPCKHITKILEMIDPQIKR